MDAKKFLKFVAIGIGAHFYLYDLSNESLMLYLTFNGYYCELRIIEECLFLCYNSGIYCFNKYGQIKWHNGNLGFDGVYLKGVINGKLIGYTQTNPPDGWEDFVLDPETGKDVVENLSSIKKPWWKLL